MNATNDDIVCAIDTIKRIALVCKVRRLTTLSQMHQRNLSKIENHINNKFDASPPYRLILCAAKNCH